MLYLVLHNLVIGIFSISIKRNILVVVAGYNFPLDFGISGKVQYVTGNPFTPYAGGVYDIDQDSYFAFPSGNYNSERLPPFCLI